MKTINFINSLIVYSLISCHFDLNNSSVVWLVGWSVVWWPVLWSWLLFIVYLHTHGDSVGRRMKPTTHLNLVPFLGICGDRPPNLIHLRVVLTYWNSFAPLACVRTRLFSSPMYLYYMIYYVNLSNKH